VRDEIEQLRKANVQPFGVNQASVDSHRAYADKMHFGFPLLTDPERAIARAYHALKDDDRGIARTVYVVRQDGTIAFAQRGAPPVADMVAAVAARAR
jgi:peroxiredoxin Q/BCP